LWELGKVKKTRAFAGPQNWTNFLGGKNGGGGMVGEKRRAQEDTARTPGKKKKSRTPHGKAAPTFHPRVRGKNKNIVRPRTWPKVARKRGGVACPKGVC